jgi:tetratricopeptide (TPR) repeat protein
VAFVRGECAVLILHVRQCEVALAAGRLDEAHDLAVARDVGRHRRGQRLITRLLKALVERGREHLCAGRHPAALADCEKAARLGGNLPDVVALRTAAMDAIAQSQRLEHRRARVLATARRHVDEGWLDLGEQALVGAPADATAVGLLRDDIARRRRLAANAATACREALQRRDLEAAARDLTKARAADPYHTDLADLAARIGEALRERIDDAVCEGDLAQASDLLEHLRTVNPDDSRTRQYEAMMASLLDASHQIKEMDYAEAGIALRRLEPLARGAAWLKNLTEQVQKAQEAAAALRASPLAGLGQPASVKDRSPAKPVTSPAGPIPWHARMQSPQDILPSKFLLHADGIGSFLVFRQPIVSIGPISSPAPADIAVVAEPALPRLTIARVDEDYFIKTSTSPTGRLLASGECVELSPRCRMTFVLPSAASTSAALDLAGAKLPRSDVRRIILLDQDLVIGPGSASHIIARGLERPVVLHLRQDQFICAGREPMQINGRTAGIGMPLPLGTPVEIGGVCFTLTRVDSVGSRGMTC